MLIQIDIITVSINLHAQQIKVKHSLMMSPYQPINVPIKHHIAIKLIFKTFY